MSTTPGTPKVAIVTGASRGIGRAVALGLSESGWHVAINYAPSADAADEAKREVESRGGRGLIVQADVSKTDDRKRLVGEVTKTWGRIDLLVNNAGVAPDVRADILDASEESFDRLININLKGPYFLTQLVARRMVEQRKDAGVGVQASGLGKSVNPKIVTISSISAFTASTNRGDYCVAKAGLS